jgi:hypothetical protein
MDAVVAAESDRVNTGSTAGPETDAISDVAAAAEITV